jgi:alkanesulfonate monooxygenase SsuD/methylene tetrahydromethanopterin reductase-like flavin-dependent oxidoreductase (luciferase family)
MNGKIKFGIGLFLLHCPTETHPWYKNLASFEMIKNVVLEAEKLGYYSVFLPDHIMYKEKGDYEVWTIASALSSVTKKIRFHPLICNNFRAPSLLAKMTSTLDVISGGRLELGIGAGWLIDEHEAYGYPFEPARTRIERLEESIRLIKKMWTEDRATFKGKYYEIKGARCDPKPIQRPHPPINIGGSGTLLLKTVAKEADICQPTVMASPPGVKRDAHLTLDEIKNRLELLRVYCREMGRDFDKIEKSIWRRTLIARDERELEQKVSEIKPKNVPLEEFKSRRLIGTPEECIEELKNYIDAGFTYFMISFLDSPDMGGMRLFAEEVLPHFQPHS